jgi:gliding motility-associated-like protein
VKIKDINKNTSLFALIWLMGTVFAFGQKQGNIWYFGENAGLDFNHSPPKVLMDGQLNSEEGGASKANMKGELLFYTDGQKVWNNNHDTMVNGFGLHGNFSTSQSAVIAAQPGDNPYYYIFTADNASGDDGISYSVVDLSLHNGKGEVIKKNIPLLKNATEKLTMINHCFGKGVWILTHEWNSNRFFAYLLTDTGLTPPVISSIGITHEDEGYLSFSEKMGCMKVSPQGDKLAVAVDAAISTIQVFEFDNSTGKVTDILFTDNNFTNNSGSTGPYGVEFSPDGSKLYLSVSAISPDNNKLYQYDMGAGGASAIKNSKTLLSSSFRYYYHTLQLAPDGKIYLAKHREKYLGVIENPNKKGADCDFVSEGIYLGGRNSTMGLPNLNPSHLRVQIGGPDKICRGETAELTAHYDGVLQWGGYKLSKEIEVAPKEDDTFTVMVDTSCPTKYHHVIEVAEPPSTKILQPRTDTIIESGQRIRFLAEGAEEYYWKPIGKLSCTQCKRPFGEPSDDQMYYLQGIDSMGCESWDTIKVQVQNEKNQIYIPNAFSPNNDGLNDKLKVIGVKDENITFSIYNRWGELMYKTQNPENGWDGTYEGKKAPTGVYSFRLRIESPHAQPLTKKGFITLVR